MSEHPFIHPDIAEWIIQSPFSNLTAEQKESVLSCISEAEYNEMHAAAILVLRSRGEKFSRKDSIREHLLEQFDQIYPTKKKQFLLYQIPLWQAALMFLLPLGLLIYMTARYNGRIEKEEVYLTKTDTLLIEKDVPQYIRIRDTIFIEKQKSYAVHSEKKGRQIKPGQVIWPDKMNNLNIQRVEQVNRIANSTRGNSIKNDTLIRQYGFVTL